MQELITFRDATLGYGRKVVLSGITFEIREGDYFGLVGPNGAGKTTILRTILGTIRPLEGTVELHPVGDHPIRFGYVPQRETIDEVLPYTVEEVVMMGRYRQIGFFRRPGKADREQVARSLDHTSIGNIGNRQFRTLSGGQKQRVLIARALATEPDVLILDEPTNGMDLSSRTAILDLINQLHDEDRLTVIMVSHLLDDVANHVQRIAIVDQNFFRVGHTAEVLTRENLSSMYNMPVNVERIAGNTIILAGGTNGKQ